MRHFVVKHPIAFGVLLAVPFAIVIIEFGTWFPVAGEMFERNRRLSEAILFTTFEFLMWICGFRNELRKTRFLIVSICFLTIHVAGVFLYSKFAGPILVWQWSILMPAEIMFFAHLYALVVERTAGSKQHGHS
jgi:hypothetical protein